jgi:glucose-6-phosphate isomerase
VLHNQFILFPRELPKQKFPNDIAASDCFSIVKSKEDLDVLENPRLKKWMRNRQIIICGVGGSSLGGQCVHAAFPNGDRSIKFVNNLDPTTLNKVFSEINPEETGFLCISKSGETLETVCQVLLAMDLIKEKDKFVFITENKPSSLRKIADEFDFLCLDHPRTIGGRFSVFSIVGMLPALLCGVDPLKIRSGGREALEGSWDSIEEGASFVSTSFQNDCAQHVSFVYSDKLAAFGAWLAQLYGESSGKSGVGVTPLTAIGSADQHSQLQLYLDGKKDKCFTFFLEKQKTSLKISEDAALPASFSYLKNKTMADVFEAQCIATMTAVGEKCSFVRKIEIPEITPEVLGALFMRFMLEAVGVCRLMGVDPFNQPAVERGKILAKNLLKDRL